MNTHHNSNKAHTSSHPKAQPRDRVFAPHTQTGRVLVIETLHAAEDIIWVSIETARSARQPERVIMF